MQMIRLLLAVLFAIGGAIFAFVADAGDEADAHEGALFDFICGLGVGSKGYDATDAFMAANVREFDLGDGLAIGAGRGAVLGVQIWEMVSGMLWSFWDSQNTLPLWQTPVYRTLTRASSFLGSGTGYASSQTTGSPCFHTSAAS